MLYEFGKVSFNLSHGGHLNEAKSIEGFSLGAKMDNKKEKKAKTVMIIHFLISQS